YPDKRMAALQERPEQSAAPAREAGVRTRTARNDGFRRRGRLWLSLALLPGLLSGCAIIRPGWDRSDVSAEVTGRTGLPLGPPPPPGLFVLPYGICLENGIRGEEAVLIALWNNAAFQEVLTDLGIARGDLIQAGLLPNPEFLYYSSAPHKPYRYLF